MKITVRILPQERRCKMTFQNAIRDIRQSCFLSQDAFAKALNISFSTVNRWETGKNIPNFIMMGKIIQFCKNNSIDYQAVDDAWRECKNASNTK